LIEAFWLESTSLAAPNNSRPEAENELKVKTNRCQVTSTSSNCQTELNKKNQRIYCCELDWIDNRHTSSCVCVLKYSSMKLSTQQY